MSGRHTQPPQSVEQAARSPAHSESETSSSGRGESDSNRVSAEHNDPEIQPGARVGKPPVEGDTGRSDRGHPAD